MMRNIILFFLAHCLLWTGLNAQSLTYKTYDYPPLEKGAVVNLKEVGPGYSADLKYLEAPQVGGPWYRQYLAAQKAISDQRFPRKSPPLQDRALAAPPVKLTDFSGNDNSQSTPLDNHLAISNDNQIVSVINRHVAVKGPDGSWLAVGKPLDGLFAPLGLDGLNKFDPRILYDPEQDRFILFAIGGNNSIESWALVAFSQTNDATGDWNLYKIEGTPFDNGTWADYPIVALAQDEVFLTCNSVKDVEPWQTGFYETLIWQIDKMKGYAGEPLAIKLWSEIHYGGKAIRNLCPVKSGTGETEDRMFFLSNRNFDVLNDTIFILELAGTQDDPNVSLTIDVRKSSTAYSVPPDAAQPIDFLATNDARILDGIWVGDQIQFVGNCKDTLSGQAAVYHGIIDDLDGAREVSGVVVTNGPDELGYPSIAYTGIQEGDLDAIIVASHSSATRPPGFSALYFDNDRQHSDWVTLKEGANAIDMQPNVPVERWGDYSGNQRKYDQPGVVWVSSSYGKSNKDNDTWIASLGSPLWFTATSEEPVEPVAMDVFPNPASDSINLEFEIPGAQRIRIVLLDVQGRLVHSFYHDRPKQEGKAAFSFDTAPLSPGLYILAVQADGRTLATRKVAVNR
jgi:hypothetical protein